MSRFVLKHKVTLILLLFCFSKAFAFETDTIKAHFSTLSPLDKVLYYDKVDLTDKIRHKDFFLQNLPKLITDENIKSNKKNLLKLKFALAEVYNIMDNDMKAIVILKEIQSDKEYKLSETEYMDLLVGFQKSYLNLQLYSNVFKINSEISTLRKKGIYFPLWSYNIKSNLYARLFLYDKAIFQLKIEIKELLNNSKRDSLIIPSAYNDLGYYYSMNNEIDSAFHYYNQSLKSAEIALKKTNFDSYTRLVASVKGNLGFLYVKINDFKTAMPLLKEDITVGLENKDNINSTFKNILLLSECYSHFKNYPEAKKILQSAEELMKAGIDANSKVYYYKAKAELLKSLHQTEDAYEYYEKSFRLSDSLNSRRQRMLLAGNEILYHLEEKDNLIEKQQLDIEKKQKSNLQLLILGLVILLLTFISYLINSIKKQKKIQKMNDEISTKNETIKDSLAEKEMLLKEIHHRVKNNLQIISGILELQNLNITDETAKIILQEGQARIQSIALIHKTLYQSENFNTVSFENYLVELLDAVQNTYRKTNLKIETQIHAEGIELSIDTAIPLSLIINEMITNCFKHAFSGKEKGNITVNLTNENTVYQLAISDDGNGLPRDFNPANLHSIGFDLIQGLTKQIGGSLDWKSENGTTITLTFKDL